MQTYVKGPYKKRPLEEKFYEKVEKTEGCWNWKGTINNVEGYGKMCHGHQIYAHRVSYEIHKGPIPPGLYIDHLCRNRSCVNPDHLEAVTQAENNIRGAKWRMSKCKPT